MLAGTMRDDRGGGRLADRRFGLCQSADPNSKQDMMAFLLLSAALTGVHVVNLAPEFSFDKQEQTYWMQTLASTRSTSRTTISSGSMPATPPTFGKLLQIAKDHRQSAADIITAVNAATTIPNFWRAASFCCGISAPGTSRHDLKKLAPERGAFIGSQVVSAKAYTQGLVWQIAQAHPMGYSNLQFGYWSREPDDPNDPSDRSNLGFITATIP